MCTENICSTFIWRGPGYPEHDTGGLCSCVCEDGTWSNWNILGRASCVPVVVHTIFGGAGLTVSVAVLFHAIYHLHRQQTYFHAQCTSASTSAIERCRWQLHTTTVTVATVNICYFSLVLADVLRWSVVVIVVNGIPQFIGSVILSSRMWMYTLSNRHEINTLARANDPRLTRESPEIIALSAWLERPRGYITACCTMSFAPGVATVLALAKYTESAVRFIALGGVIVGTIILAVFWVCGRSLMRAIDTSLQLQTSFPSTGKVEGQNGGRGYRTLLEAKRKVRRIMTVTAGLLVPAIAVVAMAIFTPYGIQAPLLMFCVPFGFVPQIWLSMNIQLHAKRSRLRQGHTGTPISAWASGPLSRPAPSRLLNSLPRPHEGRIVPTNDPLSVP
ncbi:unnamed protein product [Ectocarpus sp. 13 AM-2016]